MKRKRQAKKISDQLENFLKENPAIKEALELFDISRNQYQKALEGSYRFYTATTTTPKS